MTLVLEESDDITTQLFSLLLTSLKKDRTVRNPLFDYYFV